MDHDAFFVGISVASRHGWSIALPFWDRHREIRYTNFESFYVVGRDCPSMHLAGHNGSVPAALPGPCCTPASVNAHRALITAQDSQVYDLAIIPSTSEVHERGGAPTSPALRSVARDSRIDKKLPNIQDYYLGLIQR